MIAMEFYKGYFSTKIQPYSPSNSASNDTQLGSIPSILIWYTKKPRFECLFFENRLFVPSAEIAPETMGEAAETIGKNFRTIEFH